MKWKGFGKRGRRIVEVTSHYLREETYNDNEKKLFGIASIAFEITLHWTTN
jgi:hypothetical protein